MKNEYASMRSLTKRTAAFLLSFFIIIFVFSTSATAADTNTGSKYIKLTAPDIKSGENLIKIGDTKYIRYSITLDEYETLYYSDISFDLEFDDKILDLYTTNINLEQIYAYDVSGGEKKNTQDNIIWNEPELIDNKINFSSYSTTGMWFRGPVVILYFLVRDGASVGDVCHVTLLNIKVSVINADGTPWGTESLITSKNGTVTVTDSQNFNQGETMNLGSDTSPFKGKGDSSLDTSASDSGSGRTYLNYLIIILVLVIITGVVFFGALVILSMLKYGRLPSKKDKKLSDSNHNSKISYRK